VPLFPYNTPDRTNGVQAMVVTQLEHFSEQAGQLYENGELEHYVFSSKEFVSMWLCLPYRGRLFEARLSLTNG